MKTTNSNRFLRGLPFVFLLAAAFTSESLAQVKPGASTTPGGDGPGDVRGHIDIPEIGYGPPGSQPGDLFDFGIDVDDDGTWRPPASTVTTPNPGMGLPPGSWANLAGVDLFPAPPVGSWDHLPIGGSLLPAPRASAPPALWAPSSSIPAPGAGALFGLALLSIGGRRRRRVA